MLARTAHVEGPAEKPKRKDSCQDNGQRKTALDPGGGLGALGMFQIEICDTPMGA